MTSGLCDAKPLRRAGRIDRAEALGMSDGQLLERFAARRDGSAEAAFEALIGRHGPMVLGVCRHVLGDRHAAEDAFQATFLVLVRKAGTVRAEDSLGRWLHGVAYRVAARARSRAVRRRAHEARGAAMARREVGDPPAGHDLGAVLHEEVDRLPPAYRAPVVLCYLEGLTHDEAARCLGWPLGTVKGRLARARDLLRGRLTRRGLALGAGVLGPILAPGATPASVPEGLVRATVGAAMGHGLAGPAGAGVAPAPLADGAGAWGALRGMLAAQARMTALSLVMAGVASAGADRPVSGAAPPVAPAAARSAAAEASGPAPGDASPGDPDPRRGAGGPAGEALPGPGTPDALGDYRAARARVGRDPDAQVRLALWCEARGLRAERLKHLTLAVLADPAHATARGLMGLVAHRGGWRRPEAVAEGTRSDAELAAALAEYQARRARTPGTADAHWKLALWCEREGLEAEATAHLTAVTRLDPTREAAWRRLGCKKYEGRWMTEAAAAAEKAAAEAQRRADRSWKPRLERWRAWLADRARRDDAERLLAGVADPLAVPSVCAVFGPGGEAQQLVGVRLLGQIDAPASSRALASMAVSSRSSEVRRAATETLLRRDPRDFLGPLIGLLHDPVKFEVRPVGGPGLPGLLTVEGRRFDVRRVYAPPPLPWLPAPFGGSLELDARGWPVAWITVRSFYWSNPPALFFVSRMIAANPVGRAQLLASILGPNSGLVLRSLLETIPGAQFFQIRVTPAGERQVPVPIGRMVDEILKTARVAQQQLRGDVRAIEGRNTLLLKANRPVLQVLENFTDRELKGYREDWATWWTEEQGYAVDPPRVAPRPVLVEEVPLAYQPRPVDGYVFDRVVGYTLTARTSCFAAGTPVRTLSGPRPIESVEVGDRVLTQDTATGALSYQPVLAVAHNRPAATLRIDLGGEAIVATGIHRFWKVGRGWVMARDLKPGDTVRTLDGAAEVVAVEPATTQPVYNLEVAANASFLVGRLGTLVHDNTLVQPVARIFDAGAPPPPTGVTSD